MGLIRLECANSVPNHAHVSSEAQAHPRYACGVPADSPVRAGYKPRVRCELSGAGPSRI